MINLALTACLTLLAPPFIVDMDCAACHGEIIEQYGHGRLI